MAAHKFDKVPQNDEAPATTNSKGLKNTQKTESTNTNLAPNVPSVKSPASMTVDTVASDDDGDYGADYGDDPAPESTKQPLEPAGAPTPERSPDESAEEPKKPGLTLIRGGDDEINAPVIEASKQLKAAQIARDKAQRALTKISKQAGVTVEDVQKAEAEAQSTAAAVTMREAALEAAKRQATSKRKDRDRESKEAARSGADLGEPRGFYQEQGGDWWHEYLTKATETKPAQLVQVQICSKLEFKALVRTDELNDEQSSFALMVFTADGKPCPMLLPFWAIDDRRAPEIAAIKGAGLMIHDWIHFEKLVKIHRDRLTHARLVRQTGWTDAGDWVSPGHVPDGHVLSQAIDEKGWQRAGTLDGWFQNMAKISDLPEKLQPFLIVPSLVSLAGCLLHKTGLEGRGLHMKGDSGSGKTAAARGAYSVWCAHKEKELPTWLTTANGYENAARTSNDACLVLDEVGFAKPADVAKISYEHSAGHGKRRMQADTSARPTFTWRSNLISTGEMSIQEAIEADGNAKVKPGQLTRLLEIPFPKIPAREEIIREFKTNCELQGGLAGPAFAVYVATMGDFGARWSKVQNQWLAEHATSSPQTGRVSLWFALLKFAGLLASEVKIIPWTAAKIGVAVDSIWQVWLAEFGDGDSREDREFIDQILSLRLEKRRHFEPDAPAGQRWGQLLPDPAIGVRLYPTKKNELFGKIDAAKAVGRIALLKSRGFRVEGHNGTGGARCLDITWPKASATPATDRDDEP